MLADYFFSLEQSLSGRGRPLSRVAALAKVANVEIMTHPRNAEEFDYLVGPQCQDVLGTVTKGTYGELASKRAAERPMMLWALLASFREYAFL